MKIIGQTKENERTTKGKLKQNQRKIGEHRRKIGRTSNENQMEM